MRRSPGAPAPSRSACSPALFGAGQLRDLGTRARTDLHDRIGLLFDEELQRFAAIINAAGGMPNGSAATALRQAEETLEAAR